MKIKFLFIFFNCIVLFSTFSQDILILNNKEKIEAKVEEIGTKEVKYRKWANLNGPLYSVLKSDVFMIVYENGSQESFNDFIEESKSETHFDFADMLVPTNRYKLSSTNAEKLKKVDLNNYRDYTNARFNKVIFGTIGGISTIFSLASLANNLINFDANNTASKVVTPPVIGFSVVAVLANFLESGPKKKIKRAYSFHNEKVKGKLDLK